MTVTNISKDDKSIQFNPLVKLNQTTVDKVPESLRKKEFFNKGLFQSLINYIKSTPVSLVYATNNGYIDNNIKVTLNTIFPENSVIYINKKPYVIVDVQWSKGDWKIDTKHKPQELNISKISDPNLYTNLLNQQIISGEKQLEDLPPSVVYGPSYNGLKSATASGVKSGPSTTTATTPTTATTVTTTPTTVTTPTTSTTVTTPTTSTTVTTPLTTNAVTTLPSPPIKPASPTRLAIGPSPSSDVSTLPAPPKRLAIEGPTSSSTPSANDSSSVSEPISSDLILPVSPQINLIYSIFIWIIK
jgi:hypothetical protein